MVLFVLSSMWLSAAAVLEADKAILVFSLIVGMPLGHVFRVWFSIHRVSATTRHVICVVLGLMISCLCCGWQTLHLVLMSLICYSSMHIVHPKHCPITLFILAFAYLFYIHFLKFLDESGTYKLDVSGRMMLMVQKVTFVAWHVYDEHKANRARLKLSEEEEEKHPKSVIPPLLNYLSYLFHFASLLVGPVLSYNEHVDYIDGSDVRRHSKGKEPSPENEPSPYAKVKESLFGACCCGILYIYGRKYWKLESLSDASFVQKLGLPWSLVFLSISFRVIRFRYYFAWKMAEMSACLSGLGFTGYDENGEPSWTNCNSINIIPQETLPRITQRVKHWNVYTHLWLKRCVHSRLTRFQTVITFSLSGIWHGFYGGYALCIPTVILLIYSNQKFRTKIVPYVKRRSKLEQLLIEAIFWVYDDISTSFVMAPHVLLTYDRGSNLYRNLSYSCPIAFAILYVIGCLIPELDNSKTVMNGGINGYSNEEKAFLKNGHKVKSS